MPTLAQRLAAATRRLETVSETPRLDAELLLAHALDWPRAKLLAHLPEQHAAPDFEPMLARRLNHEPLAYIFGTWEFFSLEFLVRPPILVPRPETEHLVECAMDFLQGRSRRCRVLDLCTGTGCVALAIAKNAPRCDVTATDISPDALALARENAQRLGLGIALHQGDLFAALPSGTPPFDLIVANPPYVEAGAWTSLSPVIRKHEDPRALLAGEDGLDLVRLIVRDAPSRLIPDGVLALEIGEAQHGAVVSLFQDAGFRNIGLLNDLAGIPRIVHGILPWCPESQKGSKNTGGRKPSNSPENSSLEGR